jgi:uncharacterized protein YecE (DUF72 family)
VRTLLYSANLDVKYHIATSGWFYPEWKGQFYPKDLPSNRWFAHYTQYFSTVELNAPFYRWPRLETVKMWRRQAPEHFRYSIKVNRTITHLKRFQGTEGLIRDFYQIAGILGPQTGCFLFQLPPNFNFTPVRLKVILAQLDSAHRNVLEFRHSSWWRSEVVEALRDRSVIFCSVSAPRLPGDLMVTADDLYLRFHGPCRLFYGSYSDEDLLTWSARIAASDARTSWIYFNNTADGSAVPNARFLKAETKS